MYALNPFDIAFLKPFDRIHDILAVGFEFIIYSVMKKLPSSLVVDVSATRLHLCSALFAFEIICESFAGLAEKRQSIIDMESESRLGRMVDMTSMGSGLQVQPGSGLGPSLESSLPQPLYTRGSGQVSTDCQCM